MVKGILDNIPTLSDLKGAATDDWVDRMSHWWTVFLLIIFAVVVSTGQFVGKPIHCWVPAEFTKEYQAYTHDYCWIKNTYYIPMDKAIPVDTNERESAEITYYQWVPLILLFMAFMFKCPNLVWRMANGGAGINIDKVVEMCGETMMGSPEERKETIDNMAMYLDKWLATHRRYHWNKLVMVKEKITRLCCIFCNKRAGTYLTGLYFFMKILYVVNVIGQFFLLDAFLATNYDFYGVEILNHVWDDDSWEVSPRFPRITLCDFEIRQLENIQNFTVQCVLPINLFNEKIFIFIWFWLCFVALVSIINSVQWTVVFLLKRNRANYMKKYLKINNAIGGAFDKKLAIRFADNYMRDDGVLVMRIISKNSSDLVATDLVNRLWEIFKEKQNTNNLNGNKPNNDLIEPVTEEDKEKESLM